MFRVYKTNNKSTEKLLLFSYSLFNVQHSCEARIMICNRSLVHKVTYWLMSQAVIKHTSVVAKDQGLRQHWPVSLKMGSLESSLSM